MYFIYCLNIFCNFTVQINFVVVVVVVVAELKRRDPRNEVARYTR